MYCELKYRVFIVSQSRVYVWWGKVEYCIVSQSGVYVLWGKVEYVYCESKESICIMS